MNKTLITLAVAGILTGTAATATQAAEAFSFSLGDLLQISVVNAGPRDHEDRGPAWYNPPPPPPPEHRHEAFPPPPPEDRHEAFPPPPKHRHGDFRHRTDRDDRHAPPAGRGDKDVRPAKPQAPAQPQPSAKPQAPAKPQPSAKPQAPAKPRH